MRLTFFDPTVRKENGLPAPTDDEILLQEILIFTNFVMALKNIQLGPGPIGTTDTVYNRIPWGKKHFSRLNENTRRWMEEIEKRGGVVKGMIRDSPGMNMGMLKAGSTTFGLLCGQYRLHPTKEKTVTIRSSDDSMTFYVAAGVSNLRRVVCVNRRNLALIGINLSPSKTFFSAHNFGEYTSWYIDGDFVSQYGVETSTLRPQGKNPVDDVFAITKGSATSLTTMSINYIGAEAKIRLGIDNVRRLWCIRANNGKRPGISGEVQLIADGGLNM